MRQTFKQFVTEILDQSLVNNKPEKNNVVIVGSGMVARAFKGLSGWDDDILFSAGVSNSGEKDEKKFQKEIDLVRNHLQKVNAPSTFVYFSTTSIFDPGKKDSLYIRHKLFIEELIKSSNVNYLIIRLPNLVGFSPNPNTLTNYFADSIRQERMIKLNQNAIRHLIDVADLSDILNEIKSKFGKNKLTVNVATDRPLTAQKILSLLEEITGKKAQILVPDEELNQSNSIENNDNSAKSLIWKTNHDYHKNLLKKYYST